MFTDILVPTDFSDHATTALRLAIKLARESKGRITLMHVGLAPGVGIYDLGVYSVPMTDTLITMHEQAAKEQKHLLDRIARQEIPEDVPFQTLAVEGFPPEEIVAQAERGKHDLIVIASHGRTGLARAFLGSVAERVLRHAPVPVLVTR